MSNGFVRCVERFYVGIELKPLLPLHSLSDKLCFENIVQYIPDTYTVMEASEKYIRKEYIWRIHHCFLSQHSIHCQTFPVCIEFANFPDFLFLHDFLLFLTPTYKKMFN
jgi:hypothetical protein